MNVVNQSGWPAETADRKKTWRDKKSDEKVIRQIDQTIGFHGLG